MAVLYPAMAVYCAVEAQQCIVVAVFVGSSGSVQDLAAALILQVVRLEKPGVAVF